MTHTPKFKGSISKVRHPRFVTNTVNHKEIQQAADELGIKIEVRECTHESIKALVYLQKTNSKAIWVFDEEDWSELWKRVRELTNAR